LFGFRYAISVFLSAFPDIQWILDEQAAEGEKVINRFTWTGTHLGEFQSLLPTGKSMKVWGMIIPGQKQTIVQEA